MRLERWVLPPAIAAAVFTTVAITPPGGPPAQGLRVEVLGGASRGRPVLARVAVELAAAPNWRAPPRAEFELRGASASSNATAVRSAPAIPYVVTTLPALDELPRTLSVHAAGLGARATLHEAPMFALPAVAPPVAENGIGVRVEGGTLVPEVPGTLLVHVDGADQNDVAVAPADESVHVEPARAQLDLCHVAQFMVTVHGLDAHVVVTVPGGPERVVRRRLPVTPGGLAVRPAGEAVEVSAPIGDQNVFVVGGDANGPTWWSAVRLPDAQDANATMLLNTPAELAWVFASFSPVFDGGSGSWRIAPSGSECPHTPLGARWASNVRPLPTIPPVSLAYDGASIAARVRAVRQRHARWLALALAGAALAMLIALVLTAGLRPDPDALREVSATTQQRLRIALLGSAALLVGGFVLFYTFVLRT